MVGQKWSSGKNNKDGGEDLETFRALSKKDEKIFNILVNKEWTITKDITLTRNLPRRYPLLFNKYNGFFKIYRNRKDGESAILPRGQIKIIPLTSPDSVRIKSSNLKKFGVTRIF